MPPEFSSGSERSSGVPTGKIEPPNRGWLRIARGAGHRTAGRRWMPSPIVFGIFVAGAARSHASASKVQVALCRRSSWP